MGNKYIEVLKCALLCYTFSIEQHRKGEKHGLRHADINRK